MRKPQNNDVKHKRRKYQLPCGKKKKEQQNLQAKKYLSFLCIFQTDYHNDYDNDSKNDSNNIYSNIRNDKDIDNDNINSNNYNNIIVFPFSSFSSQKCFFSHWSCFSSSL